ncbi:MAG: PaaI family thioesterase [Candidatus Lokiarchaeota archaeon]|nr:PaaI family thioesterase [Candidatus Lokiarchaeota archaeon]
MNVYQRYIEDLIQGKVSPPPIAQLLGLKVTDFCEGCTTVEMEATNKYWNPMNTLHGGVYCDLADIAMGFSFLTTLNKDELFTTVDLRINYLKPVTTGKLIATSKIIKRGKRLGYVECEIVNEQGKLVAKASSTCIVQKRD